MKKNAIDKKLFIITATLVVVGYVIFSSASLGLLAREGASFEDTALKQAVIGIVGGGLALLILSNINYGFWRKSSLYFLCGALFLNLLIFIPGLTFTHGGATRWLDFGLFSFQPSELLKLAAILYYAAWLSSGPKQKQGTYSYGLLPLFIMIGLTAGVLLLQHDTDPIIVATLAIMFFAAGGKIRHLALVALLGAIALAGLVAMRPYILSRINVFIDPSSDALGAGYQIQQSLIAVGTGGIFGRGFGQSIQKFNFLPEPTTDSIFAVAAEEFGFVGGIVLITLFLLLALRTLKIAAGAKDPFGCYVTIGFTMLMIGQSFMNIGAMLGILPLTGVPLMFVSQGGTAMLVGLAEIGIILNISRYQSKR